MSDNENTEAIPTDVSVAEETPDLPEAEQRMVTVKVDGVESQVPLDAVVATYQKSRAADVRLEHAAKLSQQLAEKERQLQERERLLAKTPEPDLDSMLGVVAKEIYNGDEASVKQALAPVFKAVSPKFPDIDTLVEQRVQKSLHDQRVADAVQWFQAEHADMAGDEDISSFVLATAQNIMRDQPTALPLSVLRQATERVREKMSAGQTKRKPATTPVRTARMPAELPTPDPTLEDIVAQMNASRSGRKG